MLTEIRSCACGSTMQPRSLDSDLLICLNCDVPQVQEFNKQQRVPTLLDRKFELAWARRMRQYYA